ncbi:unnamed protein product [Lactuca saligna]|uniref:Uncharacterized protein n=1 Tax=Lactuca saligna TaxID=75948 RepID=A0AA36EEH9_LACSI|nr:unnamed protein product [Lactuca saligna]
MGAIFYNSQQYRPTLLLTDDHDDRVVSLHTMKFLVTMQYVLCTSLENSPQTIYNQVFRFIIFQEFSPYGKFIVTADRDFKIRGWKELELALLYMRKILEKSLIGGCKCLLKILVSWDFLRIIFNISACYHIQHFSLLPGRTDIRMKVEIPQDTELVEPLDEACIWRQARGTATETLGAKNKVESTEKICFIFPYSKDLELNLAKSFLSEMGQCTTAYPYNQLLGALVLKNYEKQDATLLSWNLMYRVD